MKVDVFGGIFLDTMIYGDKIHSSEVHEIPGGSGLNIAYGLSLLGYEVNLTGNIGSDFRGNHVFEWFEKTKINYLNVNRKNGKTGMFMTKNEVPVAVERGVNREENEMIIKRGEYAVLTSEISPLTIEKVLKMKYEKIFFDIGPIPSKEYNIPSNCITLGNKTENDEFKCEVIKMGEKGAKWGDLEVHANHKKLPYPIGCGDVFDITFIDGYLKGLEKHEILKKAVELSQKAAEIKVPLYKIETLIK